MRILLSNDDGIMAPGLNAAREVLKTIGEVFVIAPERERSGAGHGITVHKPLKPKKYTFWGDGFDWAVNGTPADCVKLGIEALLTEPPDIVVSGINLGANLSSDVHYSGTVSAAIEGALNGIPSVAISLASIDSEDFHEAAAFLKYVVPLLLTDKSCHLINVNVPPGKPVGTRVTRLGNRRYVNIFDKRIDPRGRVYYWMAGKPDDSLTDQPVPNIDLDYIAVANKYISVTPLHFDLTDIKALDKLSRILG